MAQFENVRIETVLRGLRRCPHCGVAKPEMTQLFKSDCIVPPNEQGYGYNWAAYKCNSCAHVVLVQSDLGNHGTRSVKSIYPGFEEPDPELPEKVRIYLRQAEESIHAPDGAVMLAGSAVDSMLKEKGLSKGSVYSRIDEAVASNILTLDMGEWAHEVRLGSNRPRHSDENEPHVSQEEAKQALEFTKMLGHFLFVLPNRVKKRSN